MWNPEPVFYRGKYYASSGKGNDKRRRSLRTSRLNLARQRLADLIQATKQPNVFIEDIFRAYQKEKEDSGKRLHYRWKALAPFCAHLRPDQINREFCQRYAQERKAQSGTIIRELGMLRAALRWHDPTSSAVFEFPASPPPRDRYLSREEFTRLLAQCQQPHTRLYCILALCTGARKTALLQLTWDRVDFESERINLGKGNSTKGRAILPINQTAKKALLEAHRGRLSEYVVEYHGKLVKDIKRGFKTAAKLAGLDDIYPHVLRHTAAVWMAEDGVPMSEIAQYLGHSSTRVTERVYARYSTSYLQKAASSLELE